MLAREHHGAGGGRLHRGADRGPDVDAAVELGVGRPRRAALAEVGVDRAAHRPARRQRGEHATGAAEEPLERPDRLALFLDDPEQPVHVLADRGAIGLRGLRGGVAPADADAALGRAGLRPERLPDLGVQIAPAIDLAADLAQARLGRVEEGLLGVQPRAQGREGAALVAEGGVVGIDEREPDQGHHEPAHHRADHPAGHRQTEHTAAVVAHHQQVELLGLAHRHRLRGTTARSRADAISATGAGLAMRQCPSKSTPSSTTTMGASTSP